MFDIIYPYFSLEYLSENHFILTLSIILGILLVVSYRMMILNEKSFLTPDERREHLALHLLILLLMCLMFMLINCKENLSEYMRYVIVEQTETCPGAGVSEWDYVERGHHIEIYQRPHPDVY